MENYGESEQEQDLVDWCNIPVLRVTMEPKDEPLVYPEHQEHGDADLNKHEGQCD